MESGVAGVWGDGESGVAGGKVGGESSGFSVLAMGNVQEDVERGRAVREQISECSSNMHHCVLNYGSLLWTKIGHLAE